ncbi:MAG: MFS transporter [Rhodococcus sp. (in: high G+C Gram-positive bacteria)]|jgi:MFS family permease|uniref:MFS transporter n=1 Tax=Rhodococcoides yunnanense TaxID=278209 RepID=UPI0022B0A15D|nr:MFS transporter [Rhodococcus yunnanensis]MCZ4278754.1 MFS transporter [Rhodococcus yunnanensis]
MTSDIDQKSATPRSARWRTIGTLRTGPGSSTLPFGWAPAIVLILVAFVDRIEFSLVAAVLPQLQAEWGFGDAVAGSLPTASAIAAGILAIPAAYIADRHDRGKIVTIVVILWSIATLGSALAPTFLIFYLVRVGLAAAEAIDNPASASLLADFYPPATRSTAFGWWRTSAYLGGAGIVLGGILAEWLGWRGAFVVMTIPGILVAILVSRLREPERGFADRLASDADPIRNTPTQTAPLRAQIFRVLRIRTLWYTGAALTVMSISIGGLTFWIPSLLQREFGLSEAAAATLGGGLTLLGIVLGTLVAARVTRRAVVGTLARWRVLLGGIGILVGSIFMTGALTVETTVVFVALLTLFAFFSAFALPTLTACVADVVPARDRGLGFGLLQIAATVGGAVGPLLVGVVSEAAGSLKTGMVPLLPLLVVGGILALRAYSHVDHDSQRVLVAAAAED